MISKKDMIHQGIQGINKKVTGLMKDEFGGKIITIFDALRSKTYYYLTDDVKDVKKAKGTKKMYNKNNT